MMGSTFEGWVKRKLESWRMRYSECPECGNLTLKAGKCTQCQYPMTTRESMIDVGARAIVDCRGFRYTTDPLEYGQDAHDICVQARTEARAMLAALEKHWDIFDKGD